VARRAFPRELLTATGWAILKTRLQRRCPCFVCAAHYLKRRKFRVSGRYTDYPGDGSAGNQAKGLVVGHETRNLLGLYLV